MNTTARSQRRRRLERADFVCVKDVWLPSLVAERVIAEGESYRELIERIAATDPAVTEAVIVDALQSSR